MSGPVARQHLPGPRQQGHRRGAADGRHPAGLPPGVQEGTGDEWPDDGPDPIHRVDEIDDEGRAVGEEARGHEVDADGAEAVAHPEHAAGQQQADDAGREGKPGRARGEHAQGAEDRDASADAVEQQGRGDLRQQEPGEQGAVQHAHRRHRDVGHAGELGEGRSERGDAEAQRDEHGRQQGDEDGRDVSVSHGSVRCAPPRCGRARHDGAGRCLPASPCRPRGWSAARHRGPGRDRSRSTCP